MTKYLYEGSEWDISLISKIWDKVDEIAKKTFKLNYYKPQIEIISAEGMLNAYSSVAMPIMYNHWSFGKTFIQNERQYQKGQQGLAYEVVINTDPCLVYLMENNTATLQALVLAHAACVDNQTECLTDEGWIQISKYSGQKIAQYNEAGEIHFKHPIRFIKTKTDKFLEIKARGVSQKVTPDHTLVYKIKDQIRKESAKDFLTQHLSKTRGHLGKFISHFKKGKYTIYGIYGGELRLRVAIKADASRQGNKYRFHLKKQRKIDRLEWLLQKCEIPYTKVDTYEGRVSIRFEYPEIPKEYTWEEYMNWGQTHLNIVGEEVLYWDGSVSTDSFSTTLKQSADIIQLVWASLGFGTSISKYSAEGKKDCYKVTRGSYAERSISRSRGGSPNEIVETKGGNAYCFTTDTGMWVARREDNIFVTGNCGHSHFFKNNYLFKGWTDASTILDYLSFAKNYIKKCEDLHGANRVEKLLDACHSLQAHGIDKYKKPKKDKGDVRKKEWEKYQETSFNDLWRTVPKKAEMPDFSDLYDEVGVLKHPEENLLYFIEKNSPILEPWEREIVRIVRKIAQYFYPQRQTQLMNEGTATFFHYHIMTELYDQGYLTEGAYLEFLQSHCGVIAQRDWDSKYYGGINVYALGFAMFMDIKRICEHPDDEDRKWFPDICGKPWLETILEIIANYRDESFVSQFLSPKVARKFKLFSVHVKEGAGHLIVNATHDDDSFKQIRQSLSEQYDLSRSIPVIEVVRVDWKTDRWLYLEHVTKNNQRLDYQSMKKTAHHIFRLWGFPVKMAYRDISGEYLNEV